MAMLKKKTMSTIYLFTEIFQQNNNIVFFGALQFKICKVYLAISLLVLYLAVTTRWLMQLKRTKQNILFKTSSMKSVFYL